MNTPGRPSNAISTGRRRSSSPAGASPETAAAASCARAGSRSASSSETQKHVGVTIEFVDIYTQPHVLLEGGAIYKELVPKDAVPALDIGSGKILTEVGVILQLLCDRGPESWLLPRFGTLERYRVMEWLSYVGSEFHKAVGPLFNPAMPQAAKALHRQKLLQRTMSYIEQCLATTPYLAGAEFTVADAYLFAMIGWSTYFKVDLRPYPHLARYHAGISERPSFLRTKEIIAPVLGRLKLPTFPDFASDEK